jgi:lysyl-tRNA synthetase class 2
VGAVGIVSALTPEIAARSDLVRGILPPEFPALARTLVLAGGIALIWVSRGLARGRRRAWQLAVAIVVVSVAAHLTRGLDFEEASAGLVVLVALWRTRGRFAAPADPATVRPLLLALTALVPMLVLLRLVHERELDHLSDAVGVLAVGIGAWSLWLWLRPFAARVQQRPRDRAAVESLVMEHGRDSLCYFALRADRSWFFSPSGRSVLAYRRVGGMALVAGDPVGEPAEREELVGAFRRYADARGWRVAVAGTGDPAFYRRLGFRALYLGDEAVVCPADFSLEGRSIRKVRQSVTRLRRGGYRVDVLRASEVSAELRSQLQEVSAAWRGVWPERGFGMAMDALFAYPDALLAVARNADGRVGGFLQLVPAPASAGLSLASMRRSRRTPNGLMEFLIVETLQWAKGEGVAEVSLNFAVFGSTASRSLRFVMLRLDRVFQIERLRRFSAKFDPVWRPRYFCLERWTDLPAAGLAYLQAESLLTLPGPWARTPDLSAR